MRSPVTIDIDAKRITVEGEWIERITDTVRSGTRTKRMLAIESHDDYAESRIEIVAEYNRDLIVSLSICCFCYTCDYNNIMIVLSLSVLGLSQPNNDPGFESIVRGVLSDSVQFTGNLLSERWKTVFLYG